MNKIFYMLIFLIFALNAQEIKIYFKETRYIDALNEKVTKSGQISFSNESAKICYESNEQEIMLTNDQVVVKNGKDIVQKNSREEQNIANMFKIFRAIFENDENRLKTFFKIIKKSQSEVTLRAVNSSNPISTLVYELKDGNITKLELFTQNGDRITIDVVKKM